MDGDGDHQTPERGLQLAVSLQQFGQRLGQRGHVGNEVADGARMETDHRPGVPLQFLQLGREPGLVRLQRLHALRDLPPGEAAVGDGVEHAPDLAAHLREPLRACVGLAPSRSCEAATFGDVGLKVLLDQSRVFELLTEAVQDGLLNGVQIVAPRVAAGAALVDPRAPDADPSMIPVVHGHARAARTAFQKPRQEAALTAMRDRHGVVLRPLHRLRIVPDFVLDDPQVRHVGDLPLAPRVGARHTLARVGVADHLHPIPHQPAGVDLVEEDAVAAFAVTVDGRGVPGLSAWRRHSVSVEGSGDVARRRPAKVVGKDPADHVSLGRDDLQLSRSPRDGAVAVGLTAGAAAVPDYAGHAAPDLVLQIGQEECRDQAADPHLDRVGGAVMDSADLDLGEAQALKDAGEVFLVAADAIKSLHNEDVEVAATGGVHHLGQSLASVDRRARLRAVVIHRDDIQVVTGAVVAAQGYLVIDRPIALEVRRVPGVQGYAGHLGHSWVRRREHDPLALRRAQGHGQSRPARGPAAPGAR